MMVNMINLYIDLEIFTDLFNNYLIKVINRIIRLSFSLIHKLQVLEIPQHDRLVTCQPFSETLEPNLQANPKITLIPPTKCCHKI